MPSTNDWWTGEIDWSTPAGQLLKTIFATLPKDRPVRLTIYGSAPLQLTVDRQLPSHDLNLFSEDDLDVALGNELSFQTSPRWPLRAKSIHVGNILLTIPHPLDVLIAKLSRLDANDLTAFRRVRQLTGHPTPEELTAELQNAVDLFRPAFEEDSPNQFPRNTERLWRELFNTEIDVAKEIIEPALARRNQGYGEPPKNYKAALDDFRP